MWKEQFITEIGVFVKEKALQVFQKADLIELASHDNTQAVARQAAIKVSKAIFEGWKEALVAVAEKIGRKCGVCGKNRKLKWRSKDPMKLQVLGFDFEIPNPYLECGHCDAKGLSVIKMLTGLRSGDSSTELELRAAWSGAKDSYGKAVKDLEAHHGQTVERTKARRMALDIERHAMEFAEAQRNKALEELQAESRRQGPEVLVFEGDGGKVRCGKLEKLEPGEKGYGEKTKRKSLKRKRPTHFREVITMDIRAPGEMEPRALDVLMPVLSAEGERERRMLATAGRAGMGDNTWMYGLGDMGSGLAKAFEEAFHAHNGFWAADRKHTWDYVKNAGKVLQDLDAAEWRKEMWDAIWQRNATKRNELIDQAHAHRVDNLPDEYEKCPVKTMETYLRNNWRHMRFKEMEAQKLPIVSARAESQVRDRTKDRFAVAGAWLEENIDSKATLRAIIGEDRWQEFRTYVLNKRSETFRAAFFNRLNAAVEEGRVAVDSLSDTLDGWTLPDTQRASEDRCADRESLAAQALAV